MHQKIGGFPEHSVLVFSPGILSCLLQPSLASQSRLGNLSDSAASWTPSLL